jgi:hypothetical protein
MAELDSATLQQGLLAHPVGDIDIATSAQDGWKQLNRNPVKAMEMESIFASIGKRLYAQMNIFVMCANTVTAVFSISAAVSLIPQPATMWRYDFCDYGEPLSVEVQCPYHSSPVFLTFLVLWSLYFATLFSYKFHATYDYWSNDLRFYLANDMLNNSFFMFVLIVVGMILTMVSSIGGISYVIHNGSTQSIGSILVFTGVNMFNLYNLLGGEFQALRGCSMERDFPEPVMIDLSVSRKLEVTYTATYYHTKDTPPVIKRKPVDGIMVKHRDVLDFVVECVLQSCMRSGDGSLLKNLGDPILIEDVVRKLAFLPPK